MGRPKNHWGKVALLTMVSSLALMNVGGAHAQQTGEQQERLISIAAGPLSDGLIELGDLFGVSVFAANRLVSGKLAPTVSGNLSPREAIEALLEGSPLEVSQVGPAAYEIAQKATQTEMPSPPASGLLRANQNPEPLISETIIVTGQKIERSLQDTKESVAVITSEIVQERTLLSFADAALQTPNIAGSDDDGTDVSIRGVFSSNTLVGGAGGSGDLSVIFYDNVPFNGRGRSYVPVNFWDVEQVEYLRGPQSTNVGRSALAGAVVIRTAEPELDVFDAAARFEYGNFNTYAAEGMVNIPVADTVAFRVTAERSETEGYISNNIIGDETGPDSLNVRGRLLFEPNDRFRALASVQYTDVRDGRGVYVIQDGEDLNNGFVADNNDPLEFGYEGVISSLDLNYRLSDRWDFSSITSFLDAEFVRFSDNDFTAVDAGTRDQTADEQTFTQEVRFSYNSERLRGVIGGFYFNFESDEDLASEIVASPAVVGVPSLLLPFYPSVVRAGTSTEIFDSVTNVAFFSQWDYDLTDSLQISAGLRYDLESIDRDLDQNGFVDPSTPLPDPIIAGQIAEAQQAGTGALVQGGVAQVNAFLLSQVPTNAESFDTDYEALLPEFGLTYAVTPDTNVSAFYKRGYRAGGARILADGSLNTFDPEYLDNFELAVRSSLLDGALVINANTYFGNWTDQQVNVPIDGNPNNIGTINAAKSRIWGAELQGNFALSESTNVFAGLGYARTEFRDVCRIGSTFAALPDCEIDGVAGKDLKGNDFPNSPDWTASVGVRQTFAEKWFGQANVTYQGGRFNDVENDPLFESDGFTLLNASAGYETERFSVTVYGRNLSDEFATTAIFRNGGFGGIRVRPIRPRTYGVIVSARF